MGVHDDVGKVAALVGSSESEFMAGEPVILDDVASVMFCESGGVAFWSSAFI
jgi:hypothetical protein